MPRSYPPRDLKILWGRAAGCCAFPNCRELCIVEAKIYDREAIIGKIAHIYAYSDIGPRANPALDAKQRDCYENWILLCSNHHDLVDAQPNSYTSSDLKQWKEEHENWVRERLQEEMPEIKSLELELVCRALLAPPTPPSSDYSVTDPLEKMNRNDLTNRVHFSLTLGLGKAKEVQELINDLSRFDIQFPEKLKAGFIDEYNRLLQEGYTGDSLFETLKEFACGGSLEFERQAAGLAVLAYLFDKCEIFER